MDKEIVTEAELLDAAVEHIHKSSVGRADMAHWPNHGPEMDSACLAHAIPGCTLLSEWSKIKQNPDTCVRFSMPSSCRTKRRRVEIEEDAYADSLPPSSPPPAEDAAADTGAHVAPPQRPESHLISVAFSENLRWPLVLQQQGHYCVLCMHMRKCWTCRALVVASLYNHFIFL